MKNQVLVVLFLLFIINNNIFPNDDCHIKSTFLENILKEITNEHVPTNFTQDEKVVSLLFYRINNKEFLVLGTQPGYSGSRLKGYCKCKEVLVVYSGIDDEIANKFLDINLLLKNTDSIEDLDLDKCNCGVELRIPPDYYEIKKDKLKKIVPDNTHKKKLRERLIEVGYIILPPPPPI